MIERALIIVSAIAKDYIPPFFKGGRTYDDSLSYKGLSMNTDCVGAVMVVGGGVAGIQASLDLADSGFFVYLVEKTPAIGGVMGQLDKTFPTTDCSMCILSPYLVAAGRHPNIKLITYAQVESATGEPGRFTVKVKKRPARSFRSGVPTAAPVWTLARLRAPLPDYTSYISMP